MVFVVRYIESESVPEEWRDYLRRLDPRLEREITGVVAELASAPDSLLDFCANVCYNGSIFEDTRTTPIHKVGGTFFIYRVL